MDWTDKIGQRLIDKVEINWGSDKWSTSPEHIGNTVDNCSWCKNTLKNETKRGRQHIYNPTSQTWDYRD